MNKKVIVPQAPENTPPLFAHNFMAKVGRGHLLKYSIHVVHTPFLAIFNTRNVDSHDNCRGFWKEGSFAECVLLEIIGACVDNKSRGIEATCIVSGDRG